MSKPKREKTRVKVEHDSQFEIVAADLMQLDIDGAGRAGDVPVPVKARTHSEDGAGGAEDVIDLVSPVIDRVIDLVSPSPVSSPVSWRSIGVAASPTCSSVMCDSTGEPKSKSPWGEKRSIRVDSIQSLLP
tara:strand:- start:3641 stop:4033 length:393 start_codon:yes stop_codon:yes gene_type:complete